MSTPAAFTNRWYVRPVLYVADLQRAIDFYVDRLGFVKKWHEGDGKGTVCQVDRSDCEIILCEDAARADRGRLFIELTQEGIDELLLELAQRSVPTQRVRWGYESIRIVDPDGNELLIPLLAE